MNMNIFGSQRNVLIFIVFIALPLVLYSAMSVFWNTEISSTRFVGYADLNIYYEIPGSQIINETMCLSKTVQRKSINSTLFVSVVEYESVDLSLNLWESSIVKFNITNFLFICVDYKAQTIMGRKDIECLVYEDENESTKHAPNRKLLLQSHFTRELLLLGINVVMVSDGVIFFENPLTYLLCDCDVALPADRKGIYSGFYLIKAGYAGVDLLNKTIELSMKNSSASEQVILNDVMKYMQSKKVKVKYLDIKKFPTAAVFFHKREFLQDGFSNYVILNNDRDNKVEEKIYRLKEMGLWVLDDGYYSSLTTKYLIYLNERKYNLTDKKSLEFAFVLAQYLNREVILPRFACKGPRHGCNMMKDIGLDFIEPRFHGKYREHTFLEHQKVPSKVKKSQSPYFTFAESSYLKHQVVLTVDKKFYVDYHSIAKEVVKKLKLYGIENFSVLRFYNLQY